MIAIFSSFFVLAAAQDASVVGCLAPENVAKEIGRRPFVQERSLVGIDQPLVSSGIVTVSGADITWTVNDPIEISTVISETGMTQSIEGGPAQNIGAAGASNPMLGQSGLVELLKGDLSSADANYNISDKDVSLGWGVSLTPKAKDMAEHVSQIDVTGCSKIETIKVNQSNGDVIFVKFAGE